MLPLLLGCFGGNLLLQIFGAYYMDFAWKNFDLWRMVMHGWFLITLFVCACLDMLIPEKIYFSAWWKQFLIMLLIATAVYPLALYLNGKYRHFFGSIDGNLFNFFIVNTLQFFPFYYCGALLYARREFLHRITKKQIAILLIITMLSFIIDYLLGLKLIKLQDYLPAFGGFTYRLLHACSSGGVAFLLFYYCYHLQYQSGTVIRYLIQSAIVIMIAWLLDSPNFSAGQSYAAISLFTLLLSFALYEIIRRFAWTRLVFGLK